MKVRPPRSRRRWTHPASVTSVPAAAGVSQAQGPYVTDIELQALHPYWDKPSPALTEAGFIPLGNDTSILSGLYVAYNASGTFSAAGLNKIALTLSAPATINPIPRVAFKFQDASANIWTSPPTLYGDAIAIDITDMPTAMKAAIDRFAMVFLDDATISGLTVSRTPASTRCAFYINDLVVPGNLSVGVPYSYRYSDFSADGATYLEGGIESSGSPDSEQLTLASVQGRTEVTIPASFTPAGNKFLLWRRGGVLPSSDSRPRLAAMVSTTANATGTGWTWDFTTRVFTDNIPDTDLWEASVYQIGRTAPPLGGRCLAVHAQRLFVGVYDATRKVNEVHVSWLLDGGTDAGYYFTSSVDPSDPEGETKGSLLRESGNAGDRIQGFASMIPPAYTGDMLSAHLLVLREGGPPSSLTGWRGGVGITGAFSLLAATQEAGGGCIAPQGVCQVAGHVWWAAATGLVTLAGSQIKPVAEHIKPLLSLEPIGRSRYSGAFLLWHDRKALALLPGAASTDGVIYLYDELAPPGSRWVRLAYSVGFVSGISLSGGQDAGQLYLGGRNGQLFLYTGTSDKATPAASAVAITFTLTSRKYGQGESSGPVSALAPQRAHQIVMQVEAGASLALTVTLTGDNAAARTSVWTAPSGVSQPILRSLGDVRGTTHQIDLSGSSTTGASLRSLGLTVTETSTRRG